jgi:hypothetical protein
MTVEPRFGAFEKGCMGIILSLLYDEPVIIVDILTFWVEVRDKQNNSEVIRLIPASSRVSAIQRTESDAAITMSTIGKARFVRKGFPLKVRTLSDFSTSDHSIAACSKIASSDLRGNSKQTILELSGFLRS